MVESEAMFWCDSVLWTFRQRLKPKWTLKKLVFERGRDCFRNLCTCPILQGSLHNFHGCKNFKSRWQLMNLKYNLSSSRNTSVWSGLHLHLPILRLPLNLTDSNLPSQQAEMQPAPQPSVSARFCLLFYKLSKKIQISKFHLLNAQKGGGGVDCSFLFQARTHAE